MVHGTLATLVQCARPNCVDVWLYLTGVLRRLPAIPATDTAALETLAGLAREGEGMDEDDPRQMARMMRKLHEATGMGLGQGMEEAIRRMEAGEGPDKIEEEMGDLREEEPGLGDSGQSLRQLSKRLKPPEVDETLYDL